MVDRISESSAEPPGTSGIGCREYSHANTGPKGGARVGPEKSKNPFVTPRNDR